MPGYFKAETSALVLIDYQVVQQLIDRGATVQALIRKMESALYPEGTPISSPKS